MISSYYHFLRSTNAVYKVRMHTITVSADGYLSSIKIQRFMILKTGLLTELEKKSKKNLRKAIIFGGSACFGWVGRSTANQYF